MSDLAGTSYEEWMGVEELLMLIAAVVLVMVILYVSGALVSRDWSATGGYLARLLVVAVIAVFVIPVFREAAGQFHLGDLGLLFGFVLLIVIVRFVIVEELTIADDWLAAIVISFIAAVLIYLVEEIGERFLGLELLALL